MRDNRESEGVITFGQVGRVVKTSWAIVLTCILLGIAIAGALFVISPARYTSRAVVSLTPAVLTTSSSLKDISTPTEIAIVTSTAVADRAAPLLNWTRSSATLLDHVSVTSPLDSQVLEIKYSDSTPAAAAAGANAFATAYLAYRTDTAEAELKARVDRISQRSAELQKISDAQTAVIADPKASAAQKAEAKTQQALANRLISQLRDQQAAIETTTVTPGQFVDRGLPPAERNFPRLPVFLLGGLLVGLVLGIALAMMRNLRDTRVHDARSVEERFSLPVLASVPVQRAGRTGSAGLGVLTDLGGREADAYRSLAAKLTSGVKQSCRRLLIVAAGDPHTTTTPISMAVTLAAQGQRMLLLGSREAMTNACRLVSPDETIADASHEGFQELLRIGGLRLMSFGDEVALDAAIRRLGNGELGSLLKDVDVLLIDSLNIELASTPLTLAKLADAALVVLDAGETDTHDVSATLHELRQVELPVQGLLLLEPTWRRRSGREERVTRSSLLTPQEDASTPLSR